MPTNSIDLCTLLEFAQGKLSPQESLKIIQEMERNPQVSRNAEFILGMMAYIEEECRRKEKEP